MRIVFLDIDGVLLTYESMASDRRACREILPDTNGCPAFDAECVRELNWICNVTKASIVVSSTWRQHIPELNTMRKVLIDQGINAPVFGMTPIAEGEWDSHDRGDEIAHFLAPLDVESFVILDDFDMGWAGLEAHWVQPNGNFGLQHKDAELAVSILRSEPKH